MTPSVQHDYKCGICAKNFRDSLGDMEHHMLSSICKRQILHFSRQTVNTKIRKFSAALNKV
ncbi:hypothetical protein DYY65_11360 [Nitrososphaera sp. AFS]|nr:hypothetical protein [Nitrososphaera sp. AFS]